MKTTIMIVDDDLDVRQSIMDVFGDEGYEVFGAGGGQDALKIVNQENIDLIFLDIWMPDLDGMQVLQQLKAVHPEIPVVMISGHGTIETAVQSTKLGAFDFIEKPVSLEKLVITAKNALTIYHLQQENLLLKERFQHEPQLIGQSPAMRKLQQQISVVGPTNGWVLITGENGTGKELVARAIHRLSHRADKPFIDVNCAAIPENLIESELLGYEKGAFTGAGNRKKGKFEQAHEGTIFLDEIGDMSLNTQAKILRVLQEQSLSRLGGSRAITIDVRVIAATNKNLEAEIAWRNFREDLYYRLNVIPMHIPPLRERQDDIPLLAEQFLSHYAREKGEPNKQLAPEIMPVLQQYNWPGNVRELKNLMERLAIMSRQDEISISDLPDYIRGKESKTAIASAGDDYPNSQFYSDHLSDAVSKFEKYYLAKKLKEFDGNISRTATQIGITRRNLHRKIKALAINSHQKN
ncbi:MAG: sigma-54-dependent Fis family transcriptional regulator [Deltaproteobacteria bacterium]|nr:sigma-54-dependent Fis family transcriptional regulator [Deltaproteobacteria bacterium]